MKKRMIMITLSAMMCLFLFAGCSKEESKDEIKESIPEISQTEGGGIELPDMPLE